MIIGLSGKAHSGKDTVGKFLVYDSCFESIAIAEPMKEFCRAVFEFTENQLHDKEKELPDARYAFPDAWAQASLRMDAFAPKWISRLYPPDTPAVILAGAQHELSKWFGALEGAPLTPRLALQTLGTSWGRSAACSAAPDLWIDCCLRRVKERLAVHRSDG